MAKNEKQDRQQSGRSSSSGSQHDEMKSGQGAPVDRKRATGDEASAGGPPIDPADEKFLEENKDKPK
jgi:hypothetical protein